MSAKCGVCGGPRRAGTGGRVGYLPATGEVVSIRIACAKCLARSIPLVAPPPVLERTIQSDDSDTRKVLRGLARHLRNMGKAYAASSVDPAFQFGARAFDQAADVADAWAVERAARKPDATYPEDLPRCKSTMGRLRCEKPIHHSADGHEAAGDDGHVHWP